MKQCFAIVIFLFTFRISQNIGKYNFSYYFANEISTARWYITGNWKLQPLDGTLPVTGKLRTLPIPDHCNLHEI